MADAVFVPCTDDFMDNLDGTAVALVPYHPDRPCWHLEQEAPGRARAATGGAAGRGGTATRRPADKRARRRYSAPSASTSR